MRLRVFLGAFVVLLGILWWRTGIRPDESARGREPGSPAAANAALLASRADLMPEQVAVLLLREEQAALPAARILESAGIPFMVTRDRSAALNHRVVLIPFGENAVRMNDTLRQALQDYVTSGGTMILQAPPENTLSWLTGLESATPSRSRKRLSFRTMADPAFARLTQPEQQEILLASPRSSDSIWTYGLRPRAGDGAVALADFPDEREAAIVRRRWGSGAVYTLGFDLRDVTVRPQAERHFDASRSPKNGFEPAADVWPLILAGLYQNATAFWIRLRAAPARGPLWLMTHTVGPGADMSVGQDFTRIESSRAVPSTWFVQTRTGSEQLEPPFFDQKMRALTLGLRAQQREVASAGVSHAANFSTLPYGGGEKPMQYRPATNDDGTVDDATLLGETRVSKLLLEGGQSGTVLGFRGPGLAYHPSLDAALKESGYLYDSTLSANACLSHLPFFLLEGRGLDRETGVVELPITFEDELRAAHPPSVERMLSVAREISAYDGAVVWDLRPSRDKGQRERLRGVLDGAPPGAWTTLGEAARFWSRRAAARFSFRKAGDSAVLIIDDPEGVGGLSFELPEAPKSCAAAVAVSCFGARVDVASDAAGAHADINLSFGRPRRGR